jgi:hypothetical protein
MKLTCFYRHYKVLMNCICKGFSSMNANGSVLSPDLIF